MKSAAQLPLLVPRSVVTLQKAYNIFGYSVRLYCKLKLRGLRKLGLAMHC
jgi:hypothetical protein